jgi:3-oxoadipate enol-lactonase
MTAVELHHLVEGPDDAPALVLLNSLGSTLGMWEPQIEALATEFRVVRCDTRGHGRSPVPGAPYSIDDMGGDVVALLDRLEIARAHIAGVSLGGMIALWLAIHAPERVDRIVPCCTSAKLGPPQMWRDRIAAVRAGGTEAIADGLVSRWVSPAWSAAHPEEHRRLRDMIASTPVEGYIGGCAAIEVMDLEPDLERIVAPTLVIAGADDPATPPDHGARIASRIPGARMAVIPHAMHLANIEQAPRVTERIVDHLRLP